MPSISGASQGERPTASLIFGIDRIDEDVDLAADLLGEDVGADLLLRLHEAVPALVLHLIGHRRCAEVVGLGAPDRAHT